MIGRIWHRIHGYRRTRVTGIGWKYTHVATDYSSQQSSSEVLDDEPAEATTGVLRRAVE